MNMANFVLVDDHTLLRNGLAGLIESLGHTVLFQANNGKEMIASIGKYNLPEVILMDINMPEMDGYEATQWLKENHPEIKVLALSMYDNDNAIIRMLKAGARGYILKDSEPIELSSAIIELMKNGFYYSELVSGKLIHAIHHMDEPGNSLHKPYHLSEREIEFIRFNCTELTYKEIAEKMCLSPRTIDGYRDVLFEKLHLKSRVGLAIFAIKNNIVDINHPS